MRPICWKLGLTIAGGIVIGTLGGQATIAGMAPPAALATETAADQPYAPATDITAPQASADLTRIADACADCSDYDLGYRFAAARQLRTTDQCMEYSWSYQRGCLAYLRKG